MIRRRQGSVLGAALALATAGMVTAACGGTDQFSGHTAAVGLRAGIEAGADSLDATLVALAARVSSGDSASQVRDAFIETRRRYKRIEALVEFYAPALAAALNGRRLEVDDDDAPPPSSIAPGGFAALETRLLPSWKPRDPAAALLLLGAMRETTRRIRSLGGAVQPTDAQVIELARTEIARVATLGIAGFDAQATGRATTECAEALEGLRGVLATWGTVRWTSLGRERRLLDSALANAAAQVRANPDFDAFDRITFIAFEAEPAARALDDLRRRAEIVPVQLQRAWRSDAPSVYGKGAFDPQVYAAATAPPPSEKLRALGSRLFNEPALSGTGTRSCAQCHRPPHAFTDGMPREPRLDGHGLVARHTPTLFNAALAPAQFADERAATLEDQVARVLESPTEMASSVERAAAAIRKRPEYVKAFTEVFGGPTDSAVTPIRLRYALAAYVRSLGALDSRFDRAARGDTAALSREERRGLNLFMGRAGCGTCHFAPLFNGNTPPRYLLSDVEVLGVPRDPSRPRDVDPDSGRAAVDHLDAHYRAFKTPTVRNAALTAPYMHNGAFRTLDQVLAFYERGGAAGAGARIANQTLSPDSLHLSPADRSAIIAFIRALSDTHPTAQ